MFLFSKTSSDHLFSSLKSFSLSLDDGEKCGPYEKKQAESAKASIGDVSSLKGGDDLSEVNPVIRARALLCRCICSNPVVSV